MIIGKCQLLAVELHLALRRVERPGQVDPAFELAAQFGPQLPQTRHVQIKLGLELLLQTGAAIDSVITQANVQRTDSPGLSCACSLGLQYRWLAAQTAFKVEVGIQLKTLIFE